MTKNQIEYNKLVESMRANRANERLTARRDEATRHLGLSTLQETARHNQQVELQAADNLAEQYRNNVAQIAELQRSHMANEGIAMLNATTSLKSVDEQKRAHMASEQIALDQLAEAKRHNLANEDIGLYGNEVAATAAQVSAASHVTSAGIAAGASQYASDNALLARQLEIDAQRYGIDTTAGIRRAELDETQRSNLARETETNRSNVKSESIRSANLAETMRNNLVSNAQQNRKIAADVQLRHQQNQIAQYQAETQRKSVDANISLIPSQKASNYSAAVRNAVNSAVDAIGLLKSRRK